MTKENHPLIKLLKDDRLREQAREIWRKAEEYHSKQKGDNIQDTRHCEEVEKNLHKLIQKNKKKKFDQIDLFLLCIAACLHDIGKIVDDDTIGWERDHGKRSERIILDEYEELGLDKGQARAVASIVSVHDSKHLGELPEKPVAIGTYEVNVVDLATIFCLGDMLDTTYKRTPELLSDIIYRDEDVPSKWLGRQSIMGWKLDEKNRIILQAAPEKNKIDAVYNLWEMMKEEISKISYFLEKYEYPYELGKLDVDDRYFLPEYKKEAVQHRPFPGLSFYTKQEAGIFKGRDNEIEELFSILCKHPIVLLIGKSGVGKTSLIRAGLFPFSERRSWRPVYTRPFDSPVDDIKKTIWDEFFEERLPREIVLLNVMKKVADKNKSQKILIVIDQFEDILNLNNHMALDDLFRFLRAAYSETAIPNIGVLISFREDSYVELNSRILKKITGSALSFPNLGLERLTRDGAKSALLAGLRNSRIELDQHQEKGENPLIETILDDIQKDDRIFPPDIQMVAETLCRKVDLNDKTITKKMYESLDGAKNIIAHYLLDKLNDLGSRKSEAEDVLGNLVTHRGEKIQRTLSELSELTQIETYELKAVMKEIVDLRMIQHIGSDKFEIINDYLAKTVNEELVEEEDRTKKFLEEQLDLFSQIYKEFKTPILSFPFMAKIYRNRRRIKIREEQYPLILCTAFRESSGVGWFWLKGLEDQYLLEMIRSLLDHGIPEVKKEVTNAFVRIATPEDKDKIFELLHEEKTVRETAAKAFIEIVTPQHRDIIIRMLYDEDPEVQEIGAKAFGKIASPQDKDIIIEMLRNKDIIVRETAAKAFTKIATQQDMDIIIEMLYGEYLEIQEIIGETFIEIATPEDMDLVIEMLRKNDSLETQKIGAKAFMNIVTLQDKSILIEILHNEEWNIKGVISNFVLDRKDEETLYDLSKSIYKDIKRLAARNLSKIATPQDRDIMIEMLSDRDWDIRRAAARAFIEIATPEDKEVIIEMLRDEDIIVRETAAEAFIKIATPQDKDILVDLLHDEDRGIQEIGAKAFIEIATPEDKDILIRMLYDEETNVQEIASRIFINIYRPQEIEHLLDQFSDKAQGHTEKQQIIFNALAILDREYYCRFKIS